jgi:hypothetical protein
MKDQPREPVVTLNLVHYMDHLHSRPVCFFLYIIFHFICFPVLLTELGIIGFQSSLSPYNASFAEL